MSWNVQSPARAIAPAGWRLALALLAAAILALIPVGIPPAAQAATGDIGFSGPSTTGAGNAPTGQKPESKLWWNDGRWWASMFDSTSQDWHIFYLNRSASPEAWVDTGTTIDPRASSRADTLWDGSRLYVASHIYASSNTAVTSGQPAHLYRFSYDSATKKYTLDAGFPATITDYSSETMTLDKDSTGRLWATWAQGQAVYVNASSTSDSTWGSPFKLPTANAGNLTADDIPSLVAFSNQIGIMWTNQTSSAVYFSTHANSDTVTTWGPERAITVPGPKQADDHLNIKALQSDSSGRVFAVIKTGLDELAGVGSSAPQIVVLARNTSTGAWSRATFATVADCHTRPVLMLDSTNNLLHVFATAPDSGCPFSGAVGSIFEKTSPMDNLSFTSGRGTPVMRDVTSPNLNNVSGSKQTVNATTGLVMLASNDSTNRYWFSDKSLGSAAPALKASFTASPVSGQAPLTVKFQDTSTGAPTSWSWNFGDGTTSASQNPSHTYTSAGSYTVSLTARDGNGSDSVTKSGLISVAGSTSNGSVSAGASTTSNAGTATSTVSLAKPNGVVDGDILIAQITADQLPSISTTPSSWSALPGVPALSIGSGARVFSYYHKVASASSEPSSWSWQLSAAQKWGGGVTAYQGVNTTSPFSGDGTSKVDSSYAAISLAVPGVTTASSGSMVVTGLGCDCSSFTASPPSGSTKPWESAGGQYASEAYDAKASASSTGPLTWTFGSARAVAGWAIALQPAD